MRQDPANPSLHLIVYPWVFLLLRIAAPCVMCFDGICPANIRFSWKNIEWIESSAIFVFAHNKTHSPGFPFNHRSVEHKGQCGMICHKKWKREKIIFTIGFKVCHCRWRRPTPYWTSWIVIADTRTSHTLTHSHATLDTLGSTENTYNMSLIVYEPWMIIIMIIMTMHTYSYAVDSFGSWLL